MILEIQVQIEGCFILSPDMEIKKYPYIINVFQSTEDNKYYVSVRKRIVNYIEYLPCFEKNELGTIEIRFPSSDFYQDIIALLQHIESFGAIDVGISKIHWEAPIIIWIPENDDIHLSPLSSYKEESKHISSLGNLSKDWLQNTVIFQKQLGDLYIPFSFFREGNNQYKEKRYQSSFLSFYLMLEYFFSKPNKWGIDNYEYKNNTCLRSCLIKTLDNIPNYTVHHLFLIDELKRRHKKYDEEGLLFILNIFRNELSHATNRNKNRNIFNENKYMSLAFIAMNLCLLVSIKKRLLPFVSPNNKEDFLKR